MSLATSSQSTGRVLGRDSSSSIHFLLLSSSPSLSFSFFFFYSLTLILVYELRCQYGEPDGAQGGKKQYQDLGASLFAPMDHLAA